MVHQAARVRRGRQAVLTGWREGEKPLGMGALRAMRDPIVLTHHRNGPPPVFTGVVTLYGQGLAASDISRILPFDSYAELRLRGGAADGTWVIAEVWSAHPTQLGLHDLVYEGRTYHNVFNFVER